MADINNPSSDRRAQPGMDPWEGINPVAYTIVLVVVVLIILFVLIAKGKTSEIFAGLLCLSSLTFVLLDLSFHKIRKSQNSSSTSGSDISYHPNLRIWAIGFLIGIGSSLIYLWGRVVLELLAVSSASREAVINLSRPDIEQPVAVSNISEHTLWLIGNLNENTYWLNLALLIILTIGLGSIVWGVVRICQDS